MSISQQPAGASLLSVVVPACDNPQQLRACLAALQSSNCAALETIVVDDASTVSLADVAGDFAARYLRLPIRQGPGAARNYGAREARGELILFLDSDVCVQVDTLARICAVFALDGAIDAVFGSYDDRPVVANWISQYRNLMHHFVHQTGNPEASTFWAGCGAIRRAVFLDSGGFDATCAVPAIEDIEYGMRLCQAGRRIRLDNRVLVTHQKHWTFWNMLATDFFQRGVPWARLLLRAGKIPNDLNLKWRQRAAALTAWALIAALAVGAWQHWSLWLGPLLVMLLVITLDRLTHHPLLAVTAGYAVSLVMLVTLVAYTWLLGWWVVAPIALTWAIVFLNGGFYRLLARERQLAFALFVFPLNVLYYLYSSVAFLWAAMQHLCASRVKARPDLV